MVVELVAGAVFIALAVLFVRLWPRRKYPLMGMDTWAFLLESRKIKANRFRIPKKIDSSLIEGDFDYPPGFHYLLALLPEKNIASRTRFLNPLIDVLHAWLTAGIAFWLTGSPWAALAAGFLYAVAPVTVYESFTLNSRPFASLLYSLFFLSLLAVFLGGQPWFWIAAAVLSAMIFLTHKMTTQTMVFACAAFFVFTLNPLFLLAPLAGLVLAVVLSNGFYFKIARGHITILAFWRKNIDRRRKYASDAEWFLKSVARLAFNPWLLFVLALALTRALSTWEQALFAWVAVTAGLAVLTSFKQLAFLGENQRYLEYGAMPAFVLAAGYLLEAGWPALAAALVFTVFGFVVLRVVWKKLLKANEGIVRDEKLFECVRFLKKRREEKILCLPDISGMVACCTGKKIVANSSAVAMPENEFLVFREQMQKQLRKLVEKYGVQLVVASKKTESLEVKRIGRKVFDNDAYKVYKAGKTKAKKSKVNK